MKTRKEKLDIIAKKDGRFSSEAIKFVYEGLGYTGKNITGETGHVSGKELSEGLRRLAIEKWGRLAKLVLNEWNIKTTRDFGEIVYLMIRHKWMSAQPTDAIDDFDNVYDFDDVFKTDFRFN